jgi:hypothetical protein
VDEFLVMGSDGLFDVFPNRQDLMNVIKRYIRELGDADAAAEAVVNEAVQRRRSADNVSIVLLVFNQGGRQTALSGAGGGCLGYARRACARKIYSRATRETKASELAALHGRGRSMSLTSHSLTSILESGGSGGAAAGGAGGAGASLAGGSAGGRLGALAAASQSLAVLPVAASGGATGHGRAISHVGSFVLPPALPPGGGAGPAAGLQGGSTTRGAAAAAGVAEARGSEPTSQSPMLAARPLLAAASIMPPMSLDGTAPLPAAADGIMQAGGAAGTASPPKAPARPSLPRYSSWTTDAAPVSVVTGAHGRGSSMTSRPGTPSRGRRAGGDAAAAQAPPSRSSLRNEVCRGPGVAPDATPAASPHVSTEQSAQAGMVAPGARATSSSPSASGPPAAPLAASARAAAARAEQQAPSSHGVDEEGDEVDDSTARAAASAVTPAYGAAEAGASPATADHV